MRPAGETSARVACTLTGRHSEMGITRYYECQRVTIVIDMPPGTVKGDPLIVTV